MANFVVQAHLKARHVQLQDVTLGFGFNSSDEKKSGNIRVKLNSASYSASVTWDAREGSRLIIECIATVGTVLGKD